MHLLHTSHLLFQCSGGVTVERLYIDGSDTVVRWEKEPPSEGSQGSLIVPIETEFFLSGQKER